MESLYNQLKEKIYALSESELRQVIHVIESMESSQEGLHYNGRFLGINLDDQGEMTMSLGLQNENTYGVAQGGALYTFADIAIGYHIMTKIPKDCKVFTLEMKMNYVKPGKGNKLFAKPHINHLGKNTVVSECKILDEEGDLVAIALGTFFLKRED